MATMAPEDDDQKQIRPNQTKPAVNGKPGAKSGMDRAQDQGRTFVQPVQLYGWIYKNKQSVGEGLMKQLACDRQGRLILLSHQNPMECLSQIALGATDTFIAQASFPVQDVLIWINNTTGGQVNLSLNLRRQAAATAAGNALVTTSPIVPNYFGPLPGLLPGMIGLQGKANSAGGDILSGISSVASAIVVQVFGRRALP